MNRESKIVTGDQQSNSAADDQMPSWREVFLYFLFLGFVNIGGPVAQITMMFNHMVEKRRWLSKDRFIKIMAFCHMLPGPEALQLAIYVGYLKRKLWGGVLAGVTFILPGAIAMIVLSWLYVRYGKLPQVTDALYVLKPAVLGIIAAGIIKLGRASIQNRVPCSSAGRRIRGNALRGNQLPADSFDRGRFEPNCRSRLATAQKNCADVAGNDWRNRSAGSFWRFAIISSCLAVSQNRTTEFWWRLRVACFRAARRRCTISLAFRWPVAGRRCPQRRDAGTVHVVHHICRLYRRAESLEQCSLRSLFFCHRLFS